MGKRGVMPKATERALKMEAGKLAKSGKLKKNPSQTAEEAKDAFVYGTMRKSGWTPSKGGRGKSW